MSPFVENDVLLALGIELVPVVGEFDLLRVGIGAREPVDVLARSLLDRSARDVGQPEAAVAFCERTPSAGAAVAGTSAAFAGTAHRSPPKTPPATAPIINMQAPTMKSNPLLICVIFSPHFSCKLPVFPQMVSLSSFVSCQSLFTV